MGDPTAEITLPRLGGVALVTGPLLLMLGNLLRYGIATDDSAELMAQISDSRGRFYAGTVLLLIALAVLVAAMLRLVAIAREGAEWLALLGGAIAVVGLLAATNILTVDIVRWLMTDRANDATAMVTLSDLLNEDGAFAAAVLFPAIAFPIGLLLLSGALWRSEVAPRWAPFVLGVAAVLFPLGTIPAIDGLLLLSDAVLLVGLGALARDTLRDTVRMPEGT